MNIEALLTAEIGPVAGKLHTGRSRNDQVATDLHLYVKERLPQVIAAIKQLQQVLVDKASDNVETIMPGYTHMQHAQPISYGHYLMAYSRCCSVTLNDSNSTCSIPTSLRWARRLWRERPFQSTVN